MGKRKLLLEKHRVLSELLSRQAVRLPENWNGHKPYQWQLDFWDATKTKRQLMLLAANQLGKTDTVAIAAACNLTNYYPSFWGGYRFSTAISGWVLGADFDQVKRVMQTKLLGELLPDGTFSGGIIASNFISTDPRDRVWNGVIKGALKSIVIFTIMGLRSRLCFFSYKQGQSTLMGDQPAFVIIDEQPTDPTIYPQLLIRTAHSAGGDKGILCIAMTPEHGETPLVYQFRNDLKSKQYLARVTWWDAPNQWTPEKIKDELEVTPKHLRELRSKGEPLVGSGMVYPFSEEELKTHLPLDAVPEYFLWIGSIDFGIQTGALVVQVVDPATDTVTVVDALRTDEWGINRIIDKMLSYGNIPWAWPHDGHQVKEHSGAGLTQVKQLLDGGVWMLPEHAKVAVLLPNGTKKETTNVDAGIQCVHNSLFSGKVRVNASLLDFFREYRFYSRVEGTIKHRVDAQGVKVGDHIMDGWRYGYIMKGHAATKNQGGAALLTPRYTNERQPEAQALVPRYTNHRR